MTLAEAIVILNRNKFWGYDTWQIEPQGQLNVVVPVVGGYAVNPDMAVRFATWCTHIDGTNKATSEPAELKGWGFNAQTLIDFARKMTDAEKDELVDALWPAIEKRGRESIRGKFEAAKTGMV